MVRCGLCLQPDRGLETGRPIFPAYSGAGGRFPQETVFIDDTLENIVAADALGIKAIHFTDRRTLEEQIKEVAS